ncbi:terminase [Pokkaliibacter plantistimulans]|uniref:Terminase n=1 Tax=Proteobacteria bacterium 228 TaxID=2083153 RepID=A0A2S5KT49_9PROT|nr:terminase [Pokkaliibacter plantistimulans]
MPAESGVIHGQYSLDYAPYFYGVAAAIDDPKVKEVVMMKAAQIGWTFFLIGLLFKLVKYAPRPILLLFAKSGDGQSFHNEKLINAIPANPDILELIPVDKSRKGGNRWDFKKFPGGFMKLVGSNSPGNVKSTSSVGLAVVEEPDDTSDDVSGQGDAIGLLEERVKRYPGSKILVGGTPSIKGFSKTEKRMEESDCRELPIRCHECGESHVLNFDNIHALESDEGVPPHEVYGRYLLETAVYGCPHCGSGWDDHQRKENIRKTVYDAMEAGDPYYGWVPTKPFFGKAGFNGLSELYACLPGSSLSDILKERLEAERLLEQGDPSRWIKFVNQKMGQTYEYKSDMPDSDVLRDRATDYPERTVPAGGLVLTMGVDIQHDRVAVILRAWGRGEESWCLYWGELRAETACSDKNDPVWKALDQMLFGVYNSALGVGLRVTACSIDSSDGQTNDAVYHYVRTRKNRGVRLMAIKGSNVLDAEIVTTPKKIDMSSTTKAARFGLQVHIVGTNKAKDLISERLKLQGAGPGRMHSYKSIRADYYKQITGEVKAPSRTHSGKLLWQRKSGARVEAWDCEVYALHAARVERLHLKRPEQWDALEAELRQGDMFCEPAPDDSPAPEPAPAQGTPRNTDKPAAAKPLSMADLGRMMGRR